MTKFILFSLSIGLTTFLSIPAFASSLVCRTAFSVGSRASAAISATEAAAAGPVRGASLTTTERNAFMSRAAKGDIDRGEAVKALAAADELTTQLGEPIVGDGISTCYRSFKSAAVSTVHQLLIAAKGSPTAIEAKSRIVKAYGKLFRLNEKKSEERVCTLADQGPIATPHCSIFGAVIGKLCRFKN